MKIGKKKIAALLALSAISSLLCWSFMRSEADAIRSVFDDVAENFSRTPPESLIECAARARKLSEFIVPSGFQFGVEDLGGAEIPGRTEAARLILAARGERQIPLSVAFRDLQIVVAGKTAYVRGLVDCTGSDASFAIPPPLQRHFAAQLEKRDGEWLFLKAAVQAE